jgi:hypothetical protein
MGHTQLNLAPAERNVSAALAGRVEPLRVRFDQLPYATQRVFHLVNIGEALEHVLETDEKG